MSDANAALTISTEAKIGQASPSKQSLIALAIAALGIAIFVLAQAPAAGRVLDLILSDSDDAMRLLGVRDLLAGQSWFDTHQYRYMPPDGALMHWSRLVDALIAAGIWLLSPLLGQRGAEAAVVFAWPPLLFIAYVAIAASAVRRVAPSIAAGIAVFVAGQTGMLQFLFGVGRIDHHGLQIVLSAAAVFSFAFYGRLPRAPELSGLFSALSIAVGLEGLPFLAVVGAANVLAWILRDEAAGRDMRRFALTFATASLIAFGVQTTPALWTTPACDMLALPWLVMVCGGAAVTVALQLAEPRLTTTAHRLIGAAGGALLLIGVFAWLYPECLAGPYAMVPQPYREIWLSSLPEARPGWYRLAIGNDAVFQTFGPLLVAAPTAVVIALKSNGAMRRLMAISGGCLCLGIVLSLVQVRGLYVASAFVPPVAAIAVWRIVAALRGKKLRGLRAAAAVLACVAFLSPVWSLPALAVRSVTPVKALVSAPLTDCLRKKNVSALDLLPAGAMLTPINLATYTLFYTRHSVVASGFHRAVEGIIAGIDAFRGSEAGMRRIVRERSADYVVVCADWAKAEPAGPAPFARALAEGAAAPWLEPVELDAGALMVWRVRPEALSPAP